MSLRKLITTKAFDAIKDALEQNPQLANEGLPYDDHNTEKAHPLHRICDEVMNGTCTDEEAVVMANLFLDHGAKVDGNELVDLHDTPLVAAASLHAEKVGILYIDKGATINHPGCHGGTALHWAAWVGREKLVERLIAANADIHKRCVTFQGTSLLWAVHGLKNGGPKNRHHQIKCVRLLVAAGADKTIPNKEGTMPFEFLNEEDAELRQLLS